MFQSSKRKKVNEKVEVNLCSSDDDEPEKTITPEQKDTSRGYQLSSTCTLIGSTQYEAQIYIREDEKDIRIRLVVL